ncbi:MAG: Uma2 family endonuclease [Gammaproteobacteria bacterium]
MPTVQKLAPISPEDYLEGEQHSEIKHEYISGQVYAMVGASRNHNQIAGNLHTALNIHLRNQPCQVFISDVKVRVGEAFYYPDLVVTCDPRESRDYYCEYPLLVIEVLSPSTEVRDNLEKRVAYQTLPRLQEYVLVAQDSRDIRVYRRTSEGWELETCTEGDTVHLHSVGLSLPVEAIYEKVQW